MLDNHPIILMSAGLLLYGGLLTLRSRMRGKWTTERVDDLEELVKDLDRMIAEKNRQIDELESVNMQLRQKLG